MKMPWFKFYNFDWINSRTRMNLTYAQQGIYMLLLAHSWDKPLPPNKKMLAKLCPGAKASDIKEVIVRCFLIDESGLISGRLSKERLQSEVISQGRSEVAKSRWNKEKQDAIAEQLESKRIENQNQIQNQIQNHKKKKEKKPSFKGGCKDAETEAIYLAGKEAEAKAGLPEWFTTEHTQLWHTYLHDQKELGIACPSGRKRELLNQLEVYHKEGHDITAIMKYSIQGSYKQFYRPKVKAVDPLLAPVKEIKKSPEELKLLEAELKRKREEDFKRWEEDDKRRKERLAIEKAGL